jgi:hypothetical protein
MVEKFADENVFSKKETEDAAAEPLNGFKGNSTPFFFPIFLIN